MKKIYNKFLIISTIALFAGGSYLYFSDRLISEGITPVAFGSSLVSSLGDETSPLPTAQDDQITSDISFLTTLVALKNIKIDTDFFTNKSFQNLKNNRVVIDPVKSGRVNPFGPIEASSYAAPGPNVSKVITEQPSQITTNSAILNGTVNIASETALTYFEYSITPQLSTPTTVSTKQSLVGTFIKNVTGLSPQTTYYYRACVKISNVAYCGENVSFTTIGS